MRFSTIAVSAAVFGVTAMAMPGNIVYQTEVVTITSCAPEKTNCPGRSTSAPVVSTVSPYPPPPPVVTPVCPGYPNCPPTPPAPSSGYSIPVHANTTFVHPVPSVSKPACSGYSCPAVPTPVCPGGPQCPPATMTNKPVPTYIPGTGLPYVPSGTGVPYPPKNTSVPVATSPPTFTGSASIQSFSILAVGAAVVAFFL